MRPLRLARIPGTGRRLPRNTSAGFVNTMVALGVPRAAAQAEEARLRRVAADLVALGDGEMATALEVQLRACRS